MAKSKKVDKKFRKKIDKQYVWAIAYIHREYLSRTGYEIEFYGYDKLGIEAYIPTVRLLKKKFKGKNQFEIIPLLFNYGFFKIPLKSACDPNFLLDFKKRMSCIYGWVKDGIKIDHINPKLTSKNLGFHESLKAIDFENEEVLASKLRRFVHCAIASNKEVESIKKSADEISLFNEEDLKQISKGDLITLKGYPFEGLTAEVVEINFAKQFIKVNLGIDSIMKEVKVSFQNVIYTVYSGHDPDEGFREKSIEELGKNNPRFSDKLEFNFNFS